MVDPVKKYKLKKILNEQQGYVQEFYFTKEGAKSWKI
ncbi:dehydrogenase, partial [Campylobacter coli]|nr:dehydrogenase [Campylobacter coli]